MENSLFIPGMQSAGLTATAAATLKALQAPASQLARWQPLFAETAKVPMLIEVFREDHSRLSNDEYEKWYAGLCLRAQRRLDKLPAKGELEGWNKIFDSAVRDVADTNTIQNSCRTHVGWLQAKG